MSQMRHTDSVSALVMEVVFGDRHAVTDCSAA